MSFWVSASSFHLPEIEPYITLMDTKFRNATPSRIRLLVFLYHVTQGANYRVISNQFAVGLSNVSKCVHDVSRQILLAMYHEYIHLPNPQEALQGMQEWRNQTSIPGIAATIDGTHIAIRKPVIHGEGYFNRKQFYSLNIQGF